jgi:hypothetical protein
VLRKRQDQTRPNTEPGRGFFFLGLLPHLWRGEILGGSPRAICIASSTSQKEEQMKDPRKLWGLSNTCLREQENSSLSKAKCFNTTTLIPKNYGYSSLPYWTETRGYPGAITPEPEVASLG